LFPLRYQQYQLLLLSLLFLIFLYVIVFPNLCNETLPINQLIYAEKSIIIIHLATCLN